MFVRTQNGKTLINLDKAMEVVTPETSKGRTIVAYMPGDYTGTGLATYADAKDAESAFDNLCIAIAEGRNYFAFPKDLRPANFAFQKDLRPAKQEGNGENA